MSTLSKVFVILVFLAAFVWTGVVATLFAMRVDWKDKYVKEVNAHSATVNTKNAEVQATGMELKNVQTIVDVLKANSEQLAAQLEASNTNGMSLQRELDYNKGLAAKLEATTSTFVRQLEIQLTQIKEYETKVEEARLRLVRLNSERSMAVNELQFSRQTAERLSKDLGELEASHVDLAREHNRLEETIARLNQMGARTDLAPVKPLNGKVEAALPDLGVVVISIGKNDGVMASDEFTVYRSGTTAGEFVAKIVIDKVDAGWSSGRVVLKKSDPRIGDDVSNHIVVSGMNAPGR